MFREPKLVYCPWVFRYGDDHDLLLVARLGLVGDLVKGYQLRGCDGRCDGSIEEVVFDLGRENSSG